MRLRASGRAVALPAEKYDKLDSTEYKALIKLMSTMYNIRLKPHHLSKFSVMRRVMFCTKVNEEWARPEMIPLESFRRSAHDRPFTLLRRVVRSREEPGESGGRAYARGGYRPGAARRCGRTF